MRGVRAARTGSTIISALPWSAVTSMRAAVLLDRLIDLAQARIDRLDRRDRRLQLAGVAHHVGIREVHHDHIEGRVVHRLDHNVGDSGGATSPAPDRRSQLSATAPESDLRPETASRFRH